MAVQCRGLNDAMIAGARHARCATEILSVLLLASRQHWTASGGRVRCASGALISENQPSSEGLDRPKTCFGPCSEMGRDGSRDVLFP